MQPPPTDHTRPSCTDRSSPEVGRNRRRLRGLARKVFWLWALVCFMGGGSLALSHTFAMPDEAVSRPELLAAVAASRTTEERGRWLALHVLYSRCRCSAQTLAHLRQRGVLPGVRERIVLVGAHPTYEAQARAAGFALEVLEADALDRRYHLQAAPVLVVADPRDRLRYVGGYTARKQGPEQEDVAILTRLLRGEPARPLPLFGCAVSKELARLLDPFGLRAGLSGDD